MQTINSFSDRCFVIAGQNSQDQLQVLGYCVPIEIGASVRRGGSFTVPGIQNVASATQFVFVWRPTLTDDFWGLFQLVALLPDSLWACHDQCQQLFALSDFDSDVVKLTKLISVGNTLVISAQYSTGANSFSTAPRVYCLILIGIYEWIGPTACPNSNVWPAADLSHIVCQVRHHIGVCFA